jgi:hypothetical protein
MDPELKEMFEDEWDQFKWFDPPMLQPKPFVKLLSYLPNRTKIDASNCVHTKEYKAIISKAVQNGKLLNRVQEISSRRLKICYNFHHTLTHLNVDTNGKKSYSIDGLSGKALSFLPHFNHVAHLSITNENTETLTILNLSSLSLLASSLSVESKIWIHVSLKLQP